MNTIARTSIIGEVESRERKMVNDKKLTEFRMVGFGLRINAWGDLADKVPEGGIVLVEGATKTRSYQNKDGQDRSTTEVTASSVEVIVPVPGNRPVSDDDDLPF